MSTFLCTTRQSTTSHSRDSLLHCSSLSQIPGKNTGDISPIKMASTEQVVETADKLDERETTPKAEERVVSATPKPVTDDEDSEWEDLDGMFMIASCSLISLEANSSLNRGTGRFQWPETINRDRRILETTRHTK